MHYYGRSCANILRMCVVVEDDCFEYWWVHDVDYSHVKVSEIFYMFFIMIDSKNPNPYYDAMVIDCVELIYFNSSEGSSFMIGDKICWSNIEIVAGMNASKILMDYVIISDLIKFNIEKWNGINIIHEVRWRIICIEL